MTFPVPGLTTAELVRLFEAVHQGLTERDQDRAELAEQCKLSANLALDNRALQDRLAERDQTIARLVREQAAVGLLVNRLRDTATQPANGERPHTGPPERCNCDMVHSHQQAIALNAGPGTRMVRDRTETNP